MHLKALTLLSVMIGTLGKVGPIIHKGIWGHITYVRGDVEEF